MRIQHATILGLTMMALASGCNNSTPHPQEIQDSAPSQSSVPQSQTSATSAPQLVQ
jgi:hypothetical protein